VILLLSIGQPAYALDNTVWANDFKQAQSAAQQGQFGQSELLYAEAMKEAEKFGKQSSYVGITLTGLAALNQYKGKYAQAESLYGQALAIQQKSLPADSMHLAALYNNLASLYSRQNKIPEAIYCLRKSLPIVEKQRGPNATETLMVRQNLAELQTHVSSADPLPELKRTLAEREAKLGSNNKDVAQSLNNLANYYLAHDRLAEAEPLYKRALAISEAQLGPDDQYTLQVTENLGTLYLHLRRYDLSESYLKRTLTGREKTLGPNHPDVARTLDIYARLLRTIKRTAEAKALEARSNQINSKTQ
jgi:tetratricopeptide (TPR) repeat protein